VKRLVVLLSIFAVLPAAAHADGCPVSTCGDGSSSEALPGSQLFVVRPLGPQGPLVAYDTSTGSRRFALPQGRLSGDGRTFVSFAFAKGHTTVGRYDTRDGRFLGASAVPGRAIVGTVSFDGRWAVLYRLGRGNVSRIALLDTRRGVVARSIALRGSYEAEALSPNGRLLFLIHWNRAGYDLKTYDFAKGQLRPTTLADPDEKMTGNAATAISSRDGHWLLTLYVENDGGAFVHALDLRTGVAHCIDLPWQRMQFVGPATAVLALSPDGRRLYASDPLLGRVATIDLRSLRVVHNQGFAPNSTELAAGAGLTAAVSPKGRVLVFTRGSALWLYDTAYNVVRGPFKVEAPGIVGVGFALYDGRLTVLRTDGRHVTLDAASGRRVIAEGRVPSGVFAVRAGGVGPLVGYDARASRPRFLLPDGHASADGSRYFAAIPRTPGSTSIESYSPSSGRLLRTHTVPGRWSLGAVSASGKSIAIARHARGTTWVKVLASGDGHTLRSRALRGVYTLDAVTDAADKLFLIQHYRNGHYAVRALSFRTGRLWTATLREKGEAEEPVMTGQAAGQVGSSDGRWLLTLYLDTKKRSAFVHALNLRSAYAVCIDLPSNGHALRQLRDYSLSLAPDGGVYAANGTLGVLARLDLRRQQVTGTTLFGGRTGAGGWSASAISKNGRMLYFASGKRVWSYDTFFDVVRGPQHARSPVVGLAFSKDGRRVFAARADGGVLTLDAAKGTPLAA
jgi:hypothetical protein